MSEKDTVMLTAEELDTIGEIMNISMGSAATAVSTMLEKQVAITTPSLVQDRFGSIDASELEPALIVKIKYVEGIEGINVIMLRRRDIQIILDLLMGNEFSDESENFEFDDMSMSAACEVMNQMMGSSATALSEILGIPINISTPEATLAETKAQIEEAFFGIDRTENVVAISFKMMIKDVVDTNFSCFLPTALAEKIVQMVSGGDIQQEEDLPPPPQQQTNIPAVAAVQPVQAPVSQPVERPVQPPVPSQAPPPAYQPAPPPQPTQAPPQQPVQAPPPQPIQAPFQQPMQAPNAAPQFEEVNPAGGRVPMQFDTQPIQPQQPQMPMQPQMMPQYPYGMQGMPPYMQQQMPYGYMQPPQAGYPQPHQAYNVQNPEFPDFSKQMYAPVVPGNSMGLLMGVQLDVSVVIGRTRRKIKEIMEFGQGTVVELDKQTGSPAEIVVNGQLLAYGDVIVVGDNFGVRVTEIVGTKELLDSLDSGNK